MGDSLALRVRVLQRGDESPNLEGLREQPGPGVAADRRLDGVPHRLAPGGPFVHDARIAALCVAHGTDALLTADRDFALFPELSTRDPFRGASS
jgi:hypothetical protein